MSDNWKRGAWMHFAAGAAMLEATASGAATSADMMLTLMEQREREGRFGPPGTPFHPDHPSHGALVMGMEELGTKLDRAEAEMERLKAALAQGAKDFDGAVEARRRDAAHLSEVCAAKDEAERGASVLNELHDQAEREKRKAESLLKEALRLLREWVSPDDDRTPTLDTECFLARARQEGFSDGE